MFNLIKRQSPGRIIALGFALVILIGSLLLLSLIHICWVKREDYLAAGSRIREQVKYVFDQAGVSIPFPQMDVHLIQNTDDKETAK